MRNQKRRVSEIQATKSFMLNEYGEDAISFCNEAVKAGYYKDAIKIHFQLQNDDTEQDMVKADYYTTYTSEFQYENLIQTLVDQINTTKR